MFDELALQATVTKGEPFKAHFPKLTIKPPYAQEYETAGTLTWTKEDGVRLSTIDMRSSSEKFAGPHGPRVLGPEDYWCISGKDREGFLTFSASRLSPERDEYNGATFFNNSFGNEGICFAPRQGITLVHNHWARHPFPTQTSALNFPFNRVGLLQCSTDLIWNHATSTKTNSVFGEQSSSSFDSELGEFSDGNRFMFRALDSETAQCGFYVSEEKLEDRDRYLRLAYSLATGNHCRWRVRLQTQTTNHEKRLFLGGAPRAFDHRHSGIFSSSMTNALASLLSTVVKACEEKEALPDLLATLRLTWVPRNTFLISEGLISCTVLEGFGKKLPDYLDDAEPEGAIPKPVRRKLGKALEKADVEKALIDRIKSLIGSVSKPNGSSILRTLSRRRPDLISKDELKAWKDLRNPTAHGSFSYDTGALFRDLYRVRNVLNKLVLALVGFRGGYWDYTHNRPLIFGMPE